MDMDDLGPLIGLPPTERSAKAIEGVAPPPSITEVKRGAARPRAEGAARRHAGLRAPARHERRREVHRRAHPQRARAAAGQGQRAGQAEGRRPDARSAQSGRGQRDARRRDTHRRRAEPGRNPGGAGGPRDAAQPADPEGRNHAAPASASSTGGSISPAAATRWRAGWAMPPATSPRSRAAGSSATCCWSSWGSMAARSSSSFCAATATWCCAAPRWLSMSTRAR